VEIKALESDDVSAHYDAGLMFIIYKGTLTPQTTALAYNWMIETMQCVDVPDGAVFDFREVKQFDNSNLSSAQRQSQTFNSKFNISLIPAALLVGNAYQERMTQISLNLSPQKDRKRVVWSMEDALGFIKTYNQNHPDAADVTNLFSNIDPDKAKCHYDTEQGILYVDYFNELTPEVTAQIYSHIWKLFGIVGVEAVRGAVFDFRPVTKFYYGNISTVQRSSTTLNVNYDMNHIAVALIVDGPYQENTVRVSMRVTPQEHRKRVVFSREEGLAFIEAFHKKRTQSSSRRVQNGD
jgi:hypothetical protein